MDRATIVQMWSACKIYVSGHQRNNISREDVEEAGMCVLRMRRVINFLMMILFAACTVVQFNDPDPWLWVPVYIVPCGFCFVDMLSRKVFENAARRSAVGIVHMTFCGGVLTTMAILISFRHQTAHTAELSEYIRELVGILVVFGWYLITAIFLSRNLTGQGKLKAGGIYVVLHISVVFIAGACLHVDMTSTQHYGDSSWNAPYNINATGNRTTASEAGFTT